MKKISLMAGLLSLSAVGLAQQNVSKNIQVKDTIVVVETTPSDRMTKLETEIGNLKGPQRDMQKQLRTTKPFVSTAPERRKLVVNRVGSKQLTWSKEQE